MRSTGGIGDSSASDNVWFSNFLSRAVDTSVANEPVVTAHSQTALPRSSNLTRPLLFRVSPEDGVAGASRSPGLSFEFSSLMPLFRSWRGLVNLKLSKVSAPSQLQMILGAHQRHGRFAVVPLAAQHPSQRLAQGHPFELQFLVDIRCGRAYCKLARQVQMDHFGEDTGRRNVQSHRRPTARGHARFLGEFARGAGERRLSRVKFAGRNLPQKILDAMPVLAHETRAIRAVH